jgi:anaerobic C4-dicarboxylate transporter
MKPERGDIVSLITVALLVLFTIISFFLICMLISFMNESRKRNDPEYRRYLEWKKRADEQKAAMDRQNREPEQKRDDSSWF